MDLADDRTMCHNDAGIALRQLLKKAVMVLVDGGAMKSALPTPLNGTFLNLAHDIGADLLNTLSDQDVVNIITYDRARAISLAPSPVDANTIV